VIVADGGLRDRPWTLLLGARPAKELDRGGHPSASVDGVLVEHWDVLQDEGVSKRNPRAVYLCSETVSTE